MFFFYWLVAIMPLEQHWLWGRQLFGSFTVIKALGLVCLLIALVEIANRPKFRLFFRTPQAGWYLGFLGLQCSSYFEHPSLANAWGVYSHVLSIFALFVSALALVNSGTRLYRTLLVAIGAVGFASLYTIRQHGVYAGGSDGFRAAGIFLDSNEYALVMHLWAPLAFVWASSARPMWERLFCIGCLMCIILGSTFAASRGGFLGLAAAFIFVAVRSLRPFRNLGIIIVLIVPLVMASPSSLLRRLKNPSEGDRQAGENRLILWKASLRMIRSHPLLGVGFGNFRTILPLYEDPDEQVNLIPHNTYLDVAAELGVPALLVFVGIMACAFRSLERTRCRSLAAGLAHFSRIAVGLQAGLISYLISAFFMSSWWLKMAWLLVFLTICLHRLVSERFAPRARNSSMGKLTNAELAGVV